MLIRNGRVRRRELGNLSISEKEPLERKEEFQEWYQGSQGNRAFLRGNVPQSQRQNFPLVLARKSLVVLILFFSDAGIRSKWEGVKWRH